MAGRGAGKTYAGARATLDASGRCAYLRAIGPTYADARDVCVEGESGILNIARPQIEAWNRSLGEVRFANGARLKLFSADEPDRLRGPQSAFDWYDELAAWRYAEQTLDMALMGLRLGDDPRYVVTTTPRPTPVVRRLLSDPLVVTTRARTLDNTHLPDAFKSAILARYAGTRLGRQELDAELLEDTPGALWARAQIEASRVLRAPDLARIVVGVDPPASSDGAECGIVGAGRGLDGHGYTLADLSIQGSPATWAAAVIRAFVLLGADRIVAEKNQGGEMVEYTIRQTSTEVGGVVYSGAALPITLVSASRGKVTRAEPIAALMEQGRDHHVGAFAALEDQMCSYVPGGTSPDRMDARVWAYTDLFPNAAPARPPTPSSSEDTWS
jgi:phage terminase large subunit-like protein